VAALSAGCDVVLHCNGKLEEMQEVARNVSDLTGAAARRADAAMAARRRPAAGDLAAARAEFARIIKRAAATS
jgi:beta-N-acetylhexosaminidase